MPTIQVPIVPNLCGSTANLSTFINLVNTSLDLTVQSINEELGVDLTLPGVTPIPLPGMPSLTLPEQKEFSALRKLQQTAGVRGYVGNVFAVDQGGKGLENEATYPGWPAFTVEGLGGFVVPGIDPNTHIINLLNLNYQILADLLVEEGVEWEHTPIPQVQLCGGGSETVNTGEGMVAPGLPLIIDIINTNNQGAEEAAQGAAPGSCEIPDFTIGTVLSDLAPQLVGCWTVQGSILSDGISVEFNSTSDVSFVTVNNTSPQAVVVLNDTAPCFECQVSAGDTVSAAVDVIGTGTYANVTNFTRLELYVLQTTSDPNLPITLGTTFVDAAIGVPVSTTLAISNAPVNPPGDPVTGLPGETYGNQVYIMFRFVPVFSLTLGNEFAGNFNFSNPSLAMP